jgi:hypothetical protein
MTNKDANQALQAGTKAVEAKFNYPELADLPHEVVTDLAAQDFKCCLCGESVLELRQDYWVIKYGEEMAMKMGVEYSCLLPEYWDPQHEEDLEILKKVKV